MNEYLMIAAGVIALGVSLAVAIVTVVVFLETVVKLLASIRHLHVPHKTIRKEKLTRV